jgi:hypothetical protein
VVLVDAPLDRIRPQRHAAKLCEAPVAFDNEQVIATQLHASKLTFLDADLAYVIQLKPVRVHVCDGQVGSLEWQLVALGVLGETPCHARDITESYQIKRTHATSSGRSH